MKKTLQRIYISCCDLEAVEIHEILSEVSKTSYIEGCLTERELNKKYRA